MRIFKDENWVWLAILYKKFPRCARGLYHLIILTKMKHFKEQLMHVCPRRGPLHSLSEQPTNQPTTTGKCVILVLWGFFQDFRGSRGWGPDCEVFAPVGSLCTACRSNNQQQPTKQLRNIVRFFPGFPAVQGMGLRLWGFSQDFRGSRGWGSLCEVFSRISFYATFFL